MLKQSLVDKIIESFDSIDAFLTESVGISHDVIDEKDHYILELELPGVLKHNVDIEVKTESTRNTLVVTGLRVKLPNRKYLRQELPQGEFKKCYFIPLHINIDAITAKLDNGILSVKLPKTNQPKNKSKIMVE